MNLTSFTITGDAHHESSPIAPWPGIYIHEVRYARQSFEALVFHTYILPSINEGTFAMSPIRLGSRGDSYYEYLLQGSLFQTS